MLTFQFEPLNLLLSDAAGIVTYRHWQEIALDKDEVPLVIDWLALLNEERIGRFRVFTARLDGGLIGYISFRFFKPERYATTLYVTDDVFWMAPEHRKGLTGYKMLKAAIEALPRPCKLQFKEKLTFEDGRVGALLERLGLHATEVLYSAWLK